MIYESIRLDIKKAMKDSNKIVVEVLRSLDSEIQKKSLDSKKSIDDDLVLDVIIKAIKQRNESIELFKQGKREDLVQKELAEIYIFRQYQPIQLSTEEINKIIEEQISLIGAKTIKDMGSLMKNIKPLIIGKADIKTVSDLVKNRLM